MLLSKMSKPEHETTEVHNCFIKPSDLIMGNWINSVWFIKFSASALISGLIFQPKCKGKYEYNG